MAFVACSTLTLVHEKLLCNVGTCSMYQVSLGTLVGLPPPSSVPLHFRCGVTPAGLIQIFPRIADPKLISMEYNRSHGSHELSANKETS